MENEMMYDQIARLIRDIDELVTPEVDWTDEEAVSKQLLEARELLRQTGTLLRYVVA